MSSPSTKISIGSFSLIDSTFLSSTGITIRPNSSTFRTIPVDFILFVSSILTSYASLSKYSYILAVCVKTNSLHRIYVTLRLLVITPVHLVTYLLSFLPSFILTNKRNDFVDNTLSLRKKDKQKNQP